MKIITEKIRTHLFQDGSFLYQIELQILNGDIIDADILQIERVIYTTCILVQILFFHLSFSLSFCLRLDGQIERFITKRTLKLENWEKT